jgi:hypothetical protein
MFKEGDIVKGIRDHNKNNRYIVTNVSKNFVTLKDLKTSFVSAAFNHIIDYDLEFLRRLKLEQIKNKLK